jgi:cytochrome c-type biogenesis protein CcmH
VTAVGRRDFLIGGVGVAAALLARTASGQQATNFAPMDQSAYRPTIRPPKPNAVPQMDAERRDAFEKQLKCQCTCPLDVYTCRTTDFSCPVSPAMHRDVVRLIEGGYTEEEILAAFVETYGEVALTSPKKVGFNWAAYFAPAILLATGALLLTLMIRRWSVAAQGAAAGGAGNAEGARGAGSAGAARTPSIAATDDELARLDRAVRDDS